MYVVENLTIFLKMESLFLAFGILGFGVAVLSWWQRRSFVGRELLDLSERGRVELEGKLKLVEAERLQLERRVSVVETERDQLQVKLGEQKQEIVSQREYLQREFENLTNRIFEQYSNKFRENSERGLQGLITPLRERLQEFQKKVEDTYTQESREIFSLKSEIKNIVEANQRITLETNKLSTVLRGDVKAQGNWGELVLERILEASGLREGSEYVVQGSDLKLKSEEGRTQRPDVIINLPEGKHLIVDSKVSLTNYDRFVNELDEGVRAQALKLFVQSVYQHIDGLAGKNYHELAGLSSPDFVMMFVPLEGAFALAMQSDSEIFPYAWEKRVMLVSPTTLLATLRTVASLWNQDRQNKNAFEIARQGGQLFDKFALLLEDLKDLGVTLSKGQDQYGRLVGKLSEGKGNLVSRVERLKLLGAKTTKELPEEFTVGHDSD